VNIKGIHKTSFVDFPGKISAVLFTGGCNLECGYCHNPALARNDQNLEVISGKDALEFLSRRKGLIDAVTLSGGEPTLQKDIQDFIESVKKIPLLVKLDTNGLKPEVVNLLLKKDLLDYVALDVKTSPAKYNTLTHREVDFSLIVKTLDSLRESGIDYEVRTTCVPGFCDEQDLREIGNAIGHVRRYVLQQFVSSVDMLDNSMRNIDPYPSRYLEKLCTVSLDFADESLVRGI